MSIESAYSFGLFTAAVIYGVYHLGYTRGYDLARRLHDLAGGNAGDKVLREYHPAESSGFIRRAPVDLHTAPDV